MKKYFLYIPALALLAVACNKIDNNEPAPIEEEPAPVVKMITETVSGNRGVETKATISGTDASFKWSIGDNVAVHVSQGNNHKYVVTSKGADAAAASAKFEVTYEKGYSRDAFAIYPSYIIVNPNATDYGQYNTKLDVTLPSSYTLDQVSGETSPCPMIATNTPGNGWEFFQLCSLLRLTVDAIPPAAKRLEITVSEGPDAICGNFKINRVQNGFINPEEAVLVRNGSVGSSTITITKDGTDTPFGAASLVINIPLPVDDDAYSNISISAYNAISGGNLIVSSSLSFPYKATKARAVRRSMSFAAMSAFRGYEVSTGILQRDGSTNPATYSLTAGEMVRTADPVTGEWTYSLPAGCNPFVQATYYGQSESRGKYYISWTTLKNELKADGNNIKSDSDFLPSGWRFPTGNGGSSLNTTDWSKIVFGAPKSAIKVNGTTVTEKAYAMVTVTLTEGNSYGVSPGSYNGFLLLRDGTTIPSGYLSTWGQSSKYSDNVINEAKFGELVRLGCLFISSTGYYNSGWNYPEDIHYWSSLYSSGDLSYNLENGSKSGVLFSTFRYGREVLVRLVKPL